MLFQQDLAELCNEESKMIGRSLRQLYREFKISPKRTNPNWTLTCISNACIRNNGDQFFSPKVFQFDHGGATKMLEFQNHHISVFMSRKKNKMKQQRLLLHQILLLLLSSAVLQFRLSTAVPVSLSSQEDGPSDRKLLNPSGGSGGAVSLIMDHPNGTKTYITDGEVPLSAPPPVVGSPASLMAPDRQGLIAGGDELLASAHGSPAYTQGQAPGVSSGGPPTDFYQQPLVQAGEPEGVNKVLESVQNVLKSELQTAHVPDHVDIPPIADDSWSILLPGFLNGELDFKEPIKPTIRPFNVTKLPPVTFPPTTPPSAPPRFTSTPSSTVSNPFQSINPSDAVKTTKPAVPTKPTTKTTPKPAAKPLKPYSKPQPAATTNQNSRPPTLTTTTTEEPPIAEKLVQRQPPSASLQSATSDMISVSVSTPSGPPSTLKMTAGTTVRPSRPTQAAKPGPSISKTPTVAIQPNKTKTTTSKPLTTQVKKEPVKYKPRPTPSVSVSSVATHKPVLVMNSKPVKQTENVLSTPLVSTTWAPLGSSTKQTTLTTKYGAYTTSKSPATTTPKLSPTLTTTTKYIAPATTVQSRLPTTIPTTLASTTTPPSTTIQTTTNSEVMSTLSNELAQAPLKIAASLKEPEQNVFEKVPLMPSTIRETTVTTEGTTRWEQISNATGGSSKATATEVASTLPGSTMETTDLPTTLNRVFIINNSEPQTMRTPLRPTDRQPTTETQTQTTSFGRMTTARAEPSPTTVEVPTVISTTSADTQSTVTEPPSMTTFKDQVLEAGISAVASILLDEKITGGKSPLPGRLTTPESSPTAEITSTSSIDTTITEGPSFREEGEEKSPATTAKPSESELSTMTTDRASATLALTEIVDSTTSTTTFDALTTSAVPTVTAPATIPSATIVIQTTPSVTAFITNPTIAAATVTTDITTMVTEPPKATKTPNVERTDSTTGRVEPATQSSKPKLPIKESKLNPESDAEVEAQLSISALSSSPRIVSNSASVRVCLKINVKRIILTSFWKDFRLSPTLAPTHRVEKIQKLHKAIVQHKRIQPLRYAPAARTRRRHRIRPTSTSVQLTLNVVLDIILTVTTSSMAGHDRADYLSHQRNRLLD
ncbi:unnamed protein product [Nesidiocoris tenuis]|uniref:Uncharacterized protein n=1 Tax=Nesidiocoris tenuis TaxID=355587 RepID=A0A6H5GC30_9HEMI|nr:unnamed protein product [Nesidiocoris tenuis]